MSLGSGAGREALGSDNEETEVDVELTGRGAKETAFVDKDLETEGLAADEVQSGEDEDEEECTAVDIFNPPIIEELGSGWDFKPSVSSSLSKKAFNLAAVASLSFLKSSSVTE